MVRHRLGLLSVIALCALTLTARAGELLVMPYACSAVGGVPQLTPSGSQSYAIVGRREERDFSACLPANTTPCRNWKVYRFVVDCGGSAVSWASIAASMRNDRRAWVEDGRLRIAMPARSSLSPDGVCARGARYDWRGWSHRRFCAKRRALQQPEIVEIPDGYAPMIGTNATFVADTAPEGAESHVAGIDGDPARTSPAPTPLVSPLKPALPWTADAPAKTPSPQQTDAVQENPPPKPGEQIPPASAPATPTSTPTANAESSAPGVTPVIINRPGAPQSGMPTAAAPPEPPPQGIETTPSDGVRESISTKAAPTSQTASIAPQSSAESATPIVFALNFIGPVTIGVVSLTGLLLLALTFLRLRARDECALGAKRDIGAMTLGERNLVLARSRPLAAQPQDPEPEPGGSHPGMGSEMPQTREQALRILGMGVTADVSDSAIKKIVDGLRMSWHPDRATTEEERQLRELRMKHINAAWDIFSDRR